MCWKGNHHRRRQMLSIFLIRAGEDWVSRKDCNHCNSRSSSGDFYVALIRADAVMDPEGHNLHQR